MPARPGEPVSSIIRPMRRLAALLLVVLACAGARLAAQTATGFTVSPRALAITANIGDPTFERCVALDGQQPTVNWRASVATANGGPWLGLTFVSGLFS